MAMAVYHDYCYSSVADASIAMRSHYQETQSLITTIDSFGDIPNLNVTVLTVTQYIPNVDYFLSGFTQFQVNYKYPVCSVVGPLTNHTNINLADASILCFSIIAVWALAWAFKVLRRTL